MHFAHCLVTKVPMRVTLFKQQQHAQARAGLAPVIFLSPLLPSLWDGGGSLGVRRSQNEDSMVMVMVDRTYVDDKHNAGYM